MLLGTVVDLADVADDLQEGLYATDRERRICLWNAAAERITGFSAKDVIGRHCADNILVHVDADGQSLCNGRCPLASTMSDGAPRDADVFLHHKAGHRVAVSVHIKPVSDASGHVVGAIEVFSESGDERSLRDRVTRLEQLALLDPLTLAPNRRYLASELEAQFALLQRCAMPFAVVFLDIDRFKRFNDDYGHGVGDLVLQMVARTLTATIRPHDRVGRWGGEEFLAILPNTDAAVLRTVAERFCHMVRHSNVQTDRGVVCVTMSAGATVASPDDTITSLMQRVDDLLYASKRAGGNRTTL